MVSVRNFFITVFLLNALAVKAQTVYYPAGASQQLKSTAEDVAMLLQRALPGSSFAALPYSKTPATGIVLLYDPTINFNNQACKVTGNGADYLSFAASQDNGLNFGVYEFLNQLGFRFYQPGSIWEKIPILASPFQLTDTTYSCRYKYKSWFISGGARPWIMDKNTEFLWDTYSGENGHAWALYQRRNNMTGGYRFRGHRADIMTGSYLETLKNNPCFVAPFNDSRLASSQSVPDVHSTQAMQLWSNAIVKSFTDTRSAVYADTIRYANPFRNFNYNNEQIGIEVPDGARWANAVDNSGCSPGPLMTASDQQFTLANFTAKSINSIYPDKKFNLYAYGSHAGLPSASLGVNKNIDVQVVAGVYQSETSTKGLLNRWYSGYSSVSEYQYLNIDQWSGGTPYMYLEDLRTTLNRLKDENSQGIVWETSPSKFATLPFLHAANRQLISDVNLDQTLHEFCNDFFGKSSPTVYKLLQMWSDPKTVTIANGARNNKYKLPLYFMLLNEAVEQSREDLPVVHQRLKELKAYLHYMRLYFNWTFDQVGQTEKDGQAAALCLYLARINRLQIVNSYSIISNVTSRYKTSDNIFKLYNVASGTAYLQGNLPLITGEEIDRDFIADLNHQQQLISEFKLEETGNIKAAFGKNNLLPLDNIKVTANYTQGKDFASRAEFNFIAEKASAIEIKYDPVFESGGQGQVNFTVEATGKTLGILKDFTIINGAAGAGNLTVEIPEAGSYKLTVSCMFKASVKLDIKTNGNYFFKSDPFLGNTIENYRNSPLSLPGYFYVPQGLKRVYFSLMNSKPNGAGFTKPEEVARVFLFKDPKAKPVYPKLVNSADSALFYIDIPPGNDGYFWQATKMESYKLCFANITNVLWYAAKKDCTAAAINIDVINTNGNCTTRLSTNASGTLTWKVQDGTSLYEYKSKTVDLPLGISPSAMVSLIVGNDCWFYKKLADYPGYIDKISACAQGALLGPLKSGMVIYPNPSSGLFRCMVNNQPVKASSIDIYSAHGTRTASFINSQKFNLAALPAAMYMYKIMIDQVLYTGKLVKM